MSVFCQFVPYELAEGDWDSRRDEIAALALDAIEARAPDLRDCIEELQVMGPPDIEQRIGLSGGHIFQGQVAAEPDVGSPARGPHAARRPLPLRRRDPPGWLGDRPERPHRRGRGAGRRAGLSGRAGQFARTANCAHPAPGSGQSPGSLPSAGPRPGVAARDPGSRAPHYLASMRRLFPLVAAVILVDTMFYAAITPLLPGYADDLGLSKTAAGVLSASYAAGTLIAALPSGFLAARIGFRATMLVGLGLLGVSSVVFAFADSVVVLDLARFAEGVGGACAWTGGLAWLLAAAPADRRGEMIGAALAAAIFGILLGPVIGGIATVTGPEVVFCAVAVIAAVLAAWVLATPGDRPSRGRRACAAVVGGDPQRAGAVRVLARRPAVGPLRAPSTC